MSETDVAPPPEAPKKKKRISNKRGKVKEVSYPPDFAGVEPPKSIWRNRTIGEKEYTDRWGNKSKGILHLAGTGSKPADVMFVSTCVFQEETYNRFGATARMLKGPAGNLFNRSLQRAGFEEKDWFYTSLVKYAAPKQKVKAHDVHWGAAALDDEIRAIQPKIIVCLGKPPFDHLFKTKFNLKDIQGGFFRSETYDCLLYPMDNLRVPLLKPEYLDRFGTDLKEVRRVLDEVRGVAVEKVPTDYSVVSNKAELIVLMDFLKSRDPDVLSVDTEWHGLTYVSGSLRSVQLCWDPGCAAYIRLMDDQLNYAFDCSMEEVSEIAAPVLNNPKLKFIGHNFVADALWLSHHLGIETYQRCLFDTMFAQQTLNEYSDLKLERMAVKYTDLGRYDIELTLWKKKTKFDEEDNVGYGRVPDDILIQYACRDVDSVIRIYPILKQQLEAQELWDYYDNLIRPFVTDGFTELSETGLPVNVEYLDDMREVFSRNQTILLQDFRKNIYAEAGMQLAKVMFDIDKQAYLGVFKTLVQLHQDHCAKVADASGNIVVDVVSDEFNQASELFKAFVGSERVSKLHPVFMHWWQAPAFNINSTDHLRRWFYDVKGFEPFKTTKRDGIQMAWEKVAELSPEKRLQFKPAVDKQTIKVFVNQSKMVAQLQELKSVSTIVKSFLRGVDENGKEQGLHKWVQPDDRIHANFALTETGRPRSWKPNVLNLPKFVAKPIEAAFARIQAAHPEHTDKPASLRSMVQAPDGWCLIDMDLKTAEVVALGYISGDENMINVLTQPDTQFACLAENPDKVLRVAYNELTVAPKEEWDETLIVLPDDSRLLRKDGALVHPRRDLHWEMAEAVAGKPREKLDKALMRDGAGKVGNFSVPYGASAPLLDRMVEANTGKKPPEGTGQRIIDSYESRYPTAARFLKYMEQIVEDPGVYRSVSGRVRHFFYSELVDVSGINDYTRKSILSPLVRQARNFPMQELVAATTAKAILYFIEERRKAGLRARAPMLLYDALMVLSPLEEAKVAAALMKRCLTEMVTWTIHGRTFHFDVDIGSGFRWGVKPKPEEKALLAQYLK